jgi:hypothetical protein
MREKRDKKKKNKKKTLETHQNFNDDTTGTVEKISTGRIKQHQERSPMITGVGHTRGLKTCES